MGPRAGSRELGCALYELDPGDGWAFPADAAGDYMQLTLAAIEADA